MATAVKYETRAEANDKRETKAIIIDREFKRMHEAGEPITADSVLAKARNKRHPFHPFFEWDDSAAAEKYRREQAWRLIQASKFVCFLTEKKTAPRLAEPSKVRALVSVGKGEPFRMRNEALSDAELRQQVVDRKKSELRAWCRGVVDIAELQELRTAILELL